VSVAGFRIEPDGDRRLRASGELEFATATEALRAGLAQLAAGRDWTIDLVGVTAGDSAGLAVLVEWLSAAHARGSQLVFTGIPPQMLAIARISDLDGLLLDRPG
jgi:phospholipid transport system transporter-binding protein